MSPSADTPQVFRPRRVLAMVMGAAGLLWAGVLLYLFQFDGVPFRTLGAAIFFVVFFGFSVTYYLRTAIFVDAGGFTFRGILRTQRYAYSDIRKVQVLPGPVTVYAVRARERFVHFTSIYSQHRALMELLVERAGLAPI